MAKLRVHNITMSLDGFMAGPDQTADAPMGAGTEKLHSWVFDTKFGRAMIGQEGGSEGLDNDYLERGDNGIGATIMGRNMFGPIRDEWDDSGWQGWWGDTPPYGHPVFVLTHYPRDPLPMKGGTTFNFVDDGIHSALEQAFDAADGADVRLGGGASAIRQYLAAGLVDELHLVISPVVIGGGERIFDGLDAGWPAGFEVAEFVPSETVTHAVLRKV
ncbi:dihydrofolate reductase family protein [Williamsia soli]|uniref:dihydrofolate reductase family protein n=1 Tax=Williamsia soli TaxID=364929 RepID=UPI001A9EE6C4|nr:dihydrofolate reductase family protein [Williamsia soli]